LPRHGHRLLAKSNTGWRGQRRVRGVEISGVRDRCVVLRGTMCRGRHCVTAARPAGQAGQREPTEHNQPGEYDHRDGETFRGTHRGAPQPTVDRGPAATAATGHRAGSPPRTVGTTHVLPNLQSLRRSVEDVNRPPRNHFGLGTPWAAWGGRCGPLQRSFRAGFTRPLPRHPLRRLVSSRDARGYDDGLRLVPLIPAVLDCRDAVRTTTESPAAG